MPNVKCPQGRYWLLTIPHHCFLPYLPTNVSYIKGQLERGQGGYLHWQLLVVFPDKVRLLRLKEVFGKETHAELSRSSAANDYVWKEETRVGGTSFELGKLAFKRDSKADWDKIRQLAIIGEFDSIPSDVFIRHYSSLRRITADYCVPRGIERSVFVFWGRTGTGKSYRAWQEAGLDAFPKDPRTKFWDGYRSHKHVVIDEFRGAIDISHVLRWFDKYPVIVEVKGSSLVLNAEKIWITSNISPRDWYPTLDYETKEALLRRLKITHFDCLNKFSS